MAIELTTAPEQTLSEIRSTLGVCNLIKDIFPGVKFVLNTATGFPITPEIGNYSGGGGNSPWPVMNCEQLSNFTRLLVVNRGLETITNAWALSSVLNMGTAQAINFSSNNLAASAIDAFFTDLPVTTKTPTINVAGNPGAATCDPSIATAKGYTVVTT